jgi:hypothetical protein
VPLLDGSAFFLHYQETPVPLKKPMNLNKHILYQIFNTYKFLFFNSFFKIEYDRVPNFAAQFG